ncbi:DUF2515 family protein [Metabacillus fastidiosus]|uniref:DUF2515 family protein n=1 Tax=Metabacillus fastidiosus TaxID=1458 RepID=UPI002E2261E4|nr:DUF2515 family protein [Metabacillus fastidiosus]
MDVRFFLKKKIKQTIPLEIIKELKMKSKSNTFKKSNITVQEKELVQSIKEKTDELNRNNITRTKVYLDFFKQHPEIHWALLAHMVSRNSGWLMTDLKGDLLPKLLSEKEQRHFFLFLERGNWLIFQDIYPQLLLYKQSLQWKKNLFYLLPCLHVSAFMETMWNYFWEYGNHSLLTAAIIINEQNYLETHAVQKEHFQKTVLNTIGFKLYDFLRFNHIIFPFYKKGETEKPSLTGETVRHFDSLHERILLGKRLYSILFKEKSTWQNVLLWADKHPHTASRKDYWKHLFHDINESIPGSVYHRRTEKCRLKKGAHRIYSPPLSFAWKDVNHLQVKEQDWFNDWTIFEYLEEEKTADGEIYEEYCKTIEKMELAIIAKKTIFLRRD